MANLPANTKDEEGVMVAQLEPILRSRAHLKNLPELDELNTKYKEAILALPEEEERAWAPSPLRKYKGFWCSEHLLPGVLAMQEAFEPCPSDVIVTSFMKSGTTWLKALTFAIVHRDKYAFSSSHPLRKFNPHDCVPIMEFHYAIQDDRYLETLPSPRVLGTHVSYSQLPESIKVSKCRVIYICRDPKDVVVSLWHSYSKFEWTESTKVPFNRYFDFFCKGQIPYGPVWDHVLKFYTESLHNADKILFLKYEEMLKDPVDGVTKIAEFLGCPFSEEEVRNGAAKEIVELCSFDKLKNYEVNKHGIGNETNSFFFRKGTVGDWQNYMTTEMATKLDEITKEKFRNSGFTYGMSRSNT